MPGIGNVNFNGLASGLDTKQIIEDLVNVDSQPLKRLERQKTALNTKSDVFSAMKTNLFELKDKAYEVKNSSTLGVLSASSSDEEALSVNVSSNAVAGNYSLSILSLAQSKTLSGNSYENTGTDLGFSGDAFDRQLALHSEAFQIAAECFLMGFRFHITSTTVRDSMIAELIDDSDVRLTAQRFQP